VNTATGEFAGRAD